MATMKHDTTALDAWRSFLTAHARVVDALGREMEDTTGLPLTWYEVLLYLREAPDGRLRMHELASSLLLSRSAATRFVDRMEEAGLVDRLVCDSDRRGTFVVLTDRGREAFAHSAPLHLRGIEEHFVRHLQPGEASIVLDVMSRIAESFSRPAR